MLRYLLLAVVALTCNGFQVSQLLLRHSTPSHQYYSRKQSASPSVCMAETPVHLRREALKILIASSSATMISALWATFPAPALAYTETKEDLVAQANYIVKVRIPSPLLSGSLFLQR